MRDALDNFPRYKKHLASHWISLEVVGRTVKSVPYDFEESLEPDGRRRNKVIATLAKEGYLNMVDGQIQVTSKAFNEITESKPNFSASLKEFDIDKIPNGFSWNLLPLEVKKYIFTHQDEFSFFYEPDYYTKGKAPFTTKFGTVPPEGARYYQLMVRDNDFAKVKENLLKEKEIQKYRKTNFVWGLVKLGLFDKQEAEENKLKEATSLFGTAGYATDPEGWPEELAGKISRFEQVIAEQTKMLHSMNAIKDKISEYGGWEKFLIDYDRLIRDTLQTKDEHESS